MATVDDVYGYLTGNSIGPKLESVSYHTDQQDLRGKVNNILAGETSINEQIGFAREDVWVVQGKIGAAGDAAADATLFGRLDDPTLGLGAILTGVDLANANIGVPAAAETVLSQLAAILSNIAGLSDDTDPDAPTLPNISVNLSGVASALTALASTVDSAVAQLTDIADSIAAMQTAILASNAEVLAAIGPPGVGGEADPASIFEFLSYIRGPALGG